MSNNISLRKTFQIYCSIWLLSFSNAAIGQQAPQRYTIYDSTQSKSVEIYKKQIDTNRFWVCTTDYQYCGIIDSKDRIILPVTYHGVRLLHEGLLAACIADKQCGYIDVNGAVKLPFIYKASNDFSEGIAYVTDSFGHQYFIDYTGRKQFEGDYEMCDEFSQGLAIVYKHSLRGYINRRGKLVIPIQYTEAGRFKDGKACVRIGDDYFIIDRRGKIKAKAGHWHPPPPL